MAIKYWVWLSAMVGLRPLIRYKLLDAFGDPEEVFLARERGISEKVQLNDSEKALVLNKSLQDADRILERCYRDDVTILTLSDAGYPERLKNIYDPPVALYIKGRLPAIDEQAAICVVGTRKATPYGIKMARKLSYEIALGGGLLVTGLAEGIDSAAAEGALRAGGSVVGVLGCAIDEVYPPFNGVLFADVAASGALVSEYPPETPLERRFFPERNRVMSGLSVGAVIVEAPERSGALITARLALEQGREVFAVPGNADAPNSVGTNGLLKEHAQAVTVGWDVLSEFTERFPEKISEPDKIHRIKAQDINSPVVYASASPGKKSGETTETGEGFFKLRVRNERKNVDKPKEQAYIDLREQLKTLTETQLKIVSALDTKSKHVDDIIDKTELNAGSVLSELTVLELKGFVTRESGKRFSLNVKKK